MKKHFLLCSFLIIIFSFSASAQSKKVKMTINDRFWYGLSLGNIGIGTNYATLGLAPMGGFKITEDWAIGATYKLNYSYYWFGGTSDNLHVLDHGPGVLTKYKFFGRKYFAQLEYDYISMGANGFYNTREWYPFAYIGGGLSSGDGTSWTSEWVVLYNVHPTSSNTFFPLSFGYAFLYKF